MLEETYIDDCIKRARKYQGQWTGTAGSLAADSMRLIKERRELLATIEELTKANQSLREAVEKRLASLTADDPKATGLKQAGDDQAELDALSAAWEGRKRLANRNPIERTAYTAPPAAKIIGVAGPAGAGKSLVASMVPGALVMQFADPLYSMLSALLGMPEHVLRHPSVKGRTVEWLGQSPRALLQTLGTEWGRETVALDLWVRIGMERAERAIAAGVSTVVFADVRFENEAAEIRRRGGAIWHVDRPGIDRDSHVSEAGIKFDTGDLLIQNDGGANDLRAIVERLGGAGEQTYNGK